MKKNQVGVSTIVIVFIIFAVIVSITTLYLLTTTSNNNKYFGDYNQVITDKLKQQLKQQIKINDEINKAVGNDYDIENPYILNNPYGISPLSSLVIFSTEEECTVDVYINDVFVYTVESSKNHLVPVYGLYSNANNRVLLKTPSKEKVIYIKTNIYDYELNNTIDTSMSKNEKMLFINNNSENSKTFLRGFDATSNLMFYLNFGYISNVVNKGNHLLVQYNDNKNLKPIKVEMDYLGQIFTVSSNLDEFTGNFNGSKINFYEDTIENYKLQDIKDENDFTEVKRLKTATIEQELIDAKLYTSNFQISLNDDYLTYNFEDAIDTILLVKKDSSYTYVYETNKNGIIKVDLNTDASVYVKSKGIYYCLITTLQS